MPVGPVIRQMLGPFEQPISNLYRGIFINLNDLVGQIKKWCPASNILEFGCGEGAVVERLTREYPNARITGIDISPKVGRMFQGDRQRVLFKQQDIKDFAAGNAGTFDLLIINDVMHHIPWKLHSEILTYAGRTLKPGGYLVLKDWERNYTPIHLLCYFMDRYITGDPVKYKTAHETTSLSLYKNKYQACLRIENAPLVIRPDSNL
jgi:2-polyprenyl-3-methyl-5-hydroxy-6-metoxy-1,4-benzoquinol methylase